MREDDTINFSVNFYLVAATLPPWRDVGYLVANGAESRHPSGAAEPNATGSMRAMNDLIRGLKPLPYADRILE